MLCFFVIGNDNRTNIIREMLQKENRLVAAIKDADIVVGPTPFTKDGNTVTGTDTSCDEIISICRDKILIAGAMDKVKEKLNYKKIKYHDLMELEEVAFLNAVPTAEGAISRAMEMTDITLCGANVLILGYGRIGKVLSKMLIGIGAKIFCEARNKKNLAQIEAMGYNVVDLKELDEGLHLYDVIFNTIPDMVMNRERLDKLKKECVIIDLASFPGGVDFKYAETIDIKAELALALPAKVAPKSAAIYFKKAIDEIIKDYEKNRGKNA
ncbi:MAG: dipicolinate synthase subunit DpsA [Clostridia bacterium]|nr:dipicolinate synthase subunit DpsA [Clostridia bacterium]